MCRSTIVGIGMAIAWLVAAAAASGQTVRTFDLSRGPGTGRFAAPAYSAPTVSPYVNLGVGPNGMSNYQTLVRPQIEERELLRRQSAAIDQLHQRMRGAGGQLPRASSGREMPARPRVRFMDYGHYYGTPR